MKRLVLVSINAIPALVTSYRPGIYVDYLPVGQAYAMRTYHRLTHSTLGRLLRHSPELKRTTSYAYDPKTESEIMFITIELKGGK